jgi:hypothetical protein
MPFELREDLDESVLEATATYEDCQVCASTPKALLVLIPDQGCGRRPPGKVWVPLAAIDHESEVPFLELARLPHRQAVVCGQVRLDPLKPLRRRWTP